MKKKDILDLETRRIIYNYIQKNPCSHFRNISKNLNLKVYNLNYHIKFLQKHGLITSKKEKGYLRFFIANTIGTEEKNILSFLRKKTTRDIIVTILWRYASSLKELCKYLEKSPSTISSHMKKLIENEIITPAPVGDGVIYWHRKNTQLERKTIGRETLYMLKNSELIYKTFIIHKKSILDKETWNIIDSLKIHHTNKNAKFIKDWNGAIDDIMEIYYEIFPHPYYG
jgi:predicted transcriptional regulator